MDHAVLGGHPVLDQVSPAYPGLRGRFLTCYSPVRRWGTAGVATDGAPARLACIRHAASVRPEPGSNSPSRSCDAGPEGRRVAIGTETGWRHRLPAGTRTDEVFVVRSWCGIAEIAPERRPQGARARTPALALTFLCSVVKEHTLRRHTREAGRCRSSSLGGSGADPEIGPHLIPRRPSKISAGRGGVNHLGAGDPAPPPTGACRNRRASDPTGRGQGSLPPSPRHRRQGGATTAGRHPFPCGHLHAPPGLLSPGRRPRRPAGGGGAADRRPAGRSGRRGRRPDPARPPPLERGGC